MRPTPFQRACAILGEEAVQHIRSTYNELNSNWGGSEHAIADGMIMSLMQQLPDLQVRAVLGIGGSRIARLKKVLAEGIDSLHTRVPHQTPWHALLDVDTEFMEDDAKSWVLEDGFPCQHRRPRQYFTEAKLTWKEIWQREKDKADHESIKRSKKAPGVEPPKSLGRPRKYARDPKSSHPSILTHYKPVPKEDA